MNKKEIYPEYNPNNQKPNPYNPQNTFFTFEQEAIFQKLSSCRTVELSRYEIDKMKTTGLIEVDIPDGVDWIADMPHKCDCRLNENGKIYLKYRLDQTLYVRKDSIRYRLTTFLASIGAVTGILSLLWNILLHINQLPKS